MSTFPLAAAMQKEEGEEQSQERVGGEEIACALDIANAKYRKEQHNPAAGKQQGRLVLLEIGEHTPALDGKGCQGEQGPWQELNDERAQIHARIGKDVEFIPGE